MIVGKMIMILPFLLKIVYRIVNLKYNISEFFVLLHFVSRISGVK